MRNIFGEIKCHYGGHTDGIVKIELAFWTQNLQ